MQTRCCRGREGLQPGAHQREPGTGVSNLSKPPVDINGVKAASPDKACRILAPAYQTHFQPVAHCMSSESCQHRSAASGPTGQRAESSTQKAGIGFPRVNLIVSAAPMGLSDCQAFHSGFVCGMGGGTVNWVWVVSPECPENNNPPENQTEGRLLVKQQLIFAYGYIPARQVQGTTCRHPKGRRTFHANLWKADRQVAVLF